MEDQKKTIFKLYIRMIQSGLFDSLKAGIAYAAQDPFFKKLLSGDVSLKWSPSTVEEKLVQYLDVDNGFDTSQLMEVRYWAKFKYRDESITTGQYKLH